MRVRRALACSQGALLEGGDAGVLAFEGSRGWLAATDHGWGTGCVELAVFRLLGGGVQRSLRRLELCLEVADLPAERGDRGFRPGGDGALTGPGDQCDERDAPEERAKEHGRKDQAVRFHEKQRGI
jgi:hypothetical protein